MADDSFDRLRLSFMQDVLPVSLAMLERVKNGGAGKVVEAFTELKEPLQELRDEGESAAKNFRDQLDKIQPGLGNPVVPVSVAVDDSASPEIEDEEALRELLSNIENRLDNFERFLDHSSKDGSSQENLS